MAEVVTVRARRRLKHRQITVVIDYCRVFIKLMITFWAILAAKRPTPYRVFHQTRQYCLRVYLCH